MQVIISLTHTHTSTPPYVRRVVDHTSNTRKNIQLSTTAASQPDARSRNDMTSPCFRCPPVNGRPSQNNRSRFDVILGVVQTTVEVRYRDVVAPPVGAAAPTQRRHGRHVVQRRGRRWTWVQCRAARVRVIVVDLTMVGRGPESMRQGGSVVRRTAGGG